MLSAAITIASAIVALFANTSNAPPNYMLEPYLFIDVILIVVLGTFIFRKSRSAATLAVIYFVGSKIFLWLTLGKVAGLPMTLVFLFFYANAMRATFLWHSKYRDAKTKETT